MKKVNIDAIPDKLLHVENAYKIAAATWVIEMVMKNKKAYTAHLNAKETAKVEKEIDRILDVIRNKRAKLHSIPKANGANATETQ